MSKTSAYENLLAVEKERSMINGLLEFLNWDESVNMPEGAAAARGEQKSLFARRAHELISRGDVGKWLSEAGEHAEGSDEFVNLRSIRKNYERAVKIPSALVGELMQVTSDARVAWIEAKQKKRFPLFSPSLKKIVELKREEAKCLGEGNHLYDNLMEEFEPGATVEKLNGVFSTLKKRLVPLIEKCRNRNSVVKDFLYQEFPVDTQEVVSYELLKLFGFDLNRGRMDKTEHPFCNAYHPDDVRIATRFVANDFTFGFFSTAHECGHALYEQGRNPKLAHLPTGQYVSMGIHESQSRLWENQVARSRGFWNFFFPIFQKYFPAQMESVNAENWVKAVNLVEPGFIRIESDEITYNLHIILRYELEIALIEGNLSVAELPEAWNEGMEKLLGLKPKHDSEGCLQDVHWSAGAFGYFPTYTIGNICAAQFYEAANRDLGDLAGKFSRGDFLSLRKWLNEKIHMQGRRYYSEALVKKVTGNEFSAEPLLNYFEDKLDWVYG